MVLEAINTGDPLVQVGVAIIVLVFGHLGVKLVNSVIKRFWTRGRDELTKKEIEERNEAIRYFSYALDSAVIIIVLMYLNTGIETGMLQSLIGLLPQMVSAILVAILGFLTINISTKVGSDFMKTVGIQSYFREVGLSDTAIKVFAGILKSFLYLLLLQISLSQLGIGNTFVNELVTASSWAASLLIAGLLFYGFKDLFQNYAAGIYLKNSRLVRPGEEVKIDDEQGEIGEITLFSTNVETDTGYNLLTPNKKVMESNLKFKRKKSDIKTLEDMKKHFVAQHPAYCGPAAMEMALDVFGYRHDQDEIGEASETTEDEGTEVEPLMDSVEDLTEGEVKTAFVEYDKITDLADEFKAWFNDGALIVPNFYKPEIFPEATTGHYVLSLGVEDDDILIVDPSKTTGTGGVYYVSKDRLYDAMGEHGHKRGYIVVAPKGTTAHWRIKNDLIYSDKTYYDEISKTLESRLRKILRQGRILSEVTPSSMDKYMERWRSGEKISRLWDAEEGNDETAEDN